MVDPSFMQAPTSERSVAESDFPKLQVTLYNFNKVHINFKDIPINENKTREAHRYNEAVSNENCHRPSCLFSSIKCFYSDRLQLTDSMPNIVYVSS